jgi:hypothetical protein
MFVFIAGEVNYEINQLNEQPKVGKYTKNRTKIFWIVYFPQAAPYFPPWGNDNI